MSNVINRESKSVQITADEAPISAGLNGFELFSRVSFGTNLFFVFIVTYLTFLEHSRVQSCTRSSYTVKYMIKRVRSITLFSVFSLNVNASYGRLKKSDLGSVAACFDKDGFVLDADDLADDAADGG